MQFEPSYVEKLFEIVEMRVDLKEILIPHPFIEAKRNEVRIPDRLNPLARSSDAQFSGKQIIDMVNTIDDEIGRLLSVKKSLMGTFQDAIEEHEEKKALDELD